MSCERGPDTHCFDGRESISQVTGIAVNTSASAAHFLRAIRTGDFAVVQNQTISDSFGEERSLFAHLGLAVALIESYDRLREGIPAKLTAFIDARENVVTDPGIIQEKQHPQSGETVVYIHGTPLHGAVGTLILADGTVKQGTFNYGVGDACGLRVEGLMNHTPLGESVYRSTQTA